MRGPRAALNRIRRGWTGKWDRAVEFNIKQIRRPLALPILPIYAFLRVSLVFSEIHRNIPKQ